MGNYVKYEELISRYPSLKDFAKGDVSTVDSFIIAMAETELDSRLSAGFSTPFPVTLPTVKDLVFDMCYVKIMMTSNKKKADEIWKTVKEKVDDILSGKLILKDTSGTSYLSSAAGMWSNTGEWHPVFNMHDSASEFTYVSSERLSYEEDERS